MKYEVVFNPHWLGDKHNSHPAPIGVFDTKAEALQVLEAKLNEVYGAGNWNKPNSDQWCHITSYAGLSILGRIDKKYSPEEERQRRISYLLQRIQECRTELATLGYPESEASHD